ncbi:MAG: hypothetical protein NC548_41345 [Lachnospiraceae bacterium]|nr:hypothetical protein [Lachnospiraceae bacterium]
MEERHSMHSGKLRFLPEGKRTGKGFCIKKETRDYWIVTGLLLLVLVGLHGFLPVDYGDDPFFARVFQEGDLPGYLKSRYWEWTSRIILEAVAVPLAANPAVWKVLNILAVLLLVRITADLFGIPQKMVQAEAFFALMMWIVPQESLYSSGCITTSTHYLWVLALGLTAMRPLKHWIRGEDCARWERAVCPLCILYAADMEQMAAVLLGVYLLGGVSIVFLRRKAVSSGGAAGFFRNIPRMYYLQLALSIGMVIFILSAPGNAVRKAMETESYFPGFAELGFGEKLLMGFIENSHYYLAAGQDRINYVFALLAGILPAAMLQKGLAEKKRNKETETKSRVQDGWFWIQFIVTAVPFVFYWGIGQLGNFLLERGSLTRGYAVYLLVRNRELPHEGGFSGGMVAFQAGVYLMILVCVALAILFLHGKTWETLLELVILGAGYASRLIMGFSPTLYVSGDRTALFCSMAILIVVLRNLQLFWNRPAGKYGRVVVCLYMAAAIACNLL